MMAVMLISIRSSSDTVLRKCARAYVLFLIVEIMAVAYSEGQDLYVQTRNRLLLEEKRSFTGSQINLTKEEELVNNYLLKLKKEELSQSYLNSEKFLPGRNFLLAKSDIENSEVFKFIRKLPKGASLHTHFLAGVDIGSFITNFTYQDNVYACYNSLNVFKLKVLQDPKKDADCNWKSVESYRKEYQNQGLDFDVFLKETMTLGPEAAGQSREIIWAKFKNTFSTLFDLVSYKPAFKKYVTHLLQELYDDNIFYTELRGAFMTLYDLDGTIYDSEEFITTFMETVQEFKKTHPEFIGVKYILSLYRGSDNTTLRTTLEQLINYKNLYPDFIAGFDFVGLEEEGKLLDFHDELLRVSKDLHFFFHAGETNQFGCTDLNLADAILLNSSRIGHALALAKHPRLLEYARNRNIAIELSPISNQVLKLIDDPRNHPAAILLSKGHPVVICNDDPSAWGATGLSFDWYVVFMSITWEDHGLEVLKQFAEDSIAYSAMTEKEKSEALKIWKTQWDRFIIKTVKNLKQ